MTARSDAYLNRLRKAGGKIVAVRMTAEQLAQLNRLRHEGESASACVNRLIALAYAYSAAPRETHIAAQQRAGLLNRTPI